jgi:putative colanic acid biosynthesis UDP-glucose lipid carrier transferase
LRTAALWSGIIEDMNQMSSRFETFAFAETPAETQVANSACKRLVDLVVAGLALLLLAPLLLLVAVAIKLESAGPVFFRQRRTGLGGRSFMILKFRSMRQHDDHKVAQATRNDSRITRFGAVIRALSIDELPQLLNVLRGDMSLVGPRPHATAHDLSWSLVVPDYADRFRARPGLTGFAQVSGCRGEVFSTDDIAARVRADNAYIERWSLGLDLSIALRTIPLIFADPRAY